MMGLRIKHNYRLWVCLALAVAVCLLTITSAHSQEVLQTTLTNMQESEEWWDQLWQDTFSNTTDPSTSISIYTFASAVRFILAIGGIFWLLQYGQKMAESKGTAQTMATTTQFVVPVLLAALFLMNQGGYSRMLAYGLRDVSNSWSNGVLNRQIAGQTIRSALNDQLLTQDTKDGISQQAQKCLQMPQPEVLLPSANRPVPEPNPPLSIQQRQAYDYLECIDKLGQFADQKKQDALTQNCLGIQGLNGACSFFYNFVDKIKTGSEQQKQIELEKRTNPDLQTNRDPLATPNAMGDFLGGFVQSAAYGPILSWTQWLWTSLLEMAQWLSGVFAPLFIALSIIPGRQNMFITWLIGFLTIGLAKLAYVVVIGVTAAQLSSQSVVFASDMRFPMALGLFAPGVSLAVVTAGGFAAAMSFRGQSFAVAGAAAGAMSGAFAGLAYSFARYSDRRR